MKSTLTILIILSLLISGCSLVSKTGENAPPPGDSGLSQSGFATPEPLAAAGVKLGSEVDLSGEGEPELPGIKTPAIGFNRSSRSSPSDRFPLVVASGRIIPVADKDGKQIIGWRILGEIFNGTKELVENAQMLVELVQNDSNVKNILPQSVQSGGFIPLKSGERGVYDILIAASALQEPGESFSADRISIGVRRLADATELIRLDVKDLKFTPVAADSGTIYKVTATIVNNTKSAVVGPLLRLWAVVDRGEPPQGSRTADQVVAVATWESPQEILSAGQSKRLETTLTPLTQNDRELMATQSAQLSALAAAKLLK